MKGGSTHTSANNFGSRHGEWESGEPAECCRRLCFSQRPRCDLGRALSSCAHSARWFWRQKVSRCIAKNWNRAAHSDVARAAGERSMRRGSERGQPLRCFWARGPPRWRLASWGARGNNLGGRQMLGVGLNRMGILSCLLLSVSSGRHARSHSRGANAGRVWSRGVVLNWTMQTKQPDVCTLHSALCSLQQCLQFPEVQNSQTASCCPAEGDLAGRHGGGGGETVDPLVCADVRGRRGGRWSALTRPCRPSCRSG
jgi:hypothetical protein